ALGSSAAWMGERASGPQIADAASSPLAVPRLAPPLPRAACGNSWTQRGGGGCQGVRSSPRGRGAALPQERGQAAAPPFAPAVPGWATSALATVLRREQTTE